VVKLPGFSVSLSKDLYRKLLNLEDEEGKTTSGIISEILEIFLNNVVFQKLHKMKLEKNADFSEILQEIFQKGLGE